MTFFKMYKTPSKEEQVIEQHNLLLNIKSPPPKKNLKHKDDTTDNKEKIKTSAETNQKIILPSPTPTTVTDNIQKVNHAQRNITITETKRNSKPYEKSQRNIKTRKTKKHTHAYNARKDAYMHNIDNPQLTKEEPFLPSFQLMEEASLPHVNMTLPTNVQISAVVDSGASHCYMGRELYNSLENHKDYAKRSIRIKVQTGNGKIETNATVATVPTIIKTNRGQPIKYNIPFLVVDFLGHEAYLGVSILFKKKWFRSLTSKYLYTDKKLNRKIPISWVSSTQSAKLLTSTEIYLMPHESTIVPTYPNKTIDNDDTHVISNYIAQGEDQTEEEEIYSIVPQITNYCEQKFYNIIITNNSSDPIGIDKNTPIASIESTKSQKFYHTITELHEDNNNHNHHPDTSVEPTKLLKMVNKRTLAPHATTHPEDEPIQEHLLAKSEHLLRSEETKLGQQRTTDRTKNQINNKYKNNDVSRTTDPADNLAYDMINNNTYMNEEDKRKAKADYDSKHYFEQPASEVADKGRKSTELKPDSPKISVEEAIAKVKTDHLSKEMKQIADKILQDNQNIFTLNEYDIGNVDENIAVCDPEIRDDMANHVMNIKYIPPNYQLRDELDNMISTLESNGIVSRTDAPTPVISNILICKKRSGEPRYILDSRATNLVCKRQQVSMCPTNDVLQEAGSADFVTQLDISNAFFSINVAESKTPLFSFYNSRRERYCFRKMPQGFHSSPAVLTKCLNSVTKDIPECIAYADDLFLCTKLPHKKGYTPTYEEKMRHHLKQLDKLMKSIGSHNLKIKPEKMFVANDIITVLGYTLNCRKYYIPEAKVTGITSTPTPKTFRQLKSFLCKQKYFTKFIWNSAGISEPMQELLRNNKPFKWTKEADDSFNLVKKRVADHIAISAADLTLPIHVSSDASLVSAAFIAYQILPSGEINYLGCTSRLFTQAERKFNSYRLECLALLSGLAAFDYILRFAHNIFAVVDAKAMIFLRLSKLSSGYSFRVAESLSYYPLTIHHLKTRGTTNWLADIVSRSVDIKDVETQKSPLTEKEAQQLLDMITLPPEYTIDKDTLHGYLTDTGGQTNRPSKKQNKYTKSTVTEQNRKPTMMPKRPPKVPRTVKNHPFYKNQRHQLSRNKVDFTKPQEPQYQQIKQSLYKRHGNNNTTNSGRNINTHGANNRLHVMQKTTLETIYEEDETLEANGNQKPLQINELYDDDIPETCLNAIYKLLTNNTYRLNTAKLLIQNEIGQHTENNMDTNEQQNTNNLNNDNHNGGEQTHNDQNTIDSLILNAKVLKDGHISLETLREEQNNDIEINNIKTTDPMPKQYFLRNGFLLARIHDTERIVIPESLFKQLSYQYHHSLLGLHQTPDTMYRRLSRIFYHKDLQARLQQIYQSCLVCRSERNRKTRLQTLGEKTIPIQPRHTWQFDVCCGLPSGACKYVFVFTDITTLFTILVPSATREANHIKQAFETHIVKPFGAKTIFSDREPGILSGTFQTYCSENNIQALNTPGYSPWDSGIVEAHVSYTKQLLRLYCKQTNINHSQLLNIINNVMNKRLLSNVTNDKRAYTPEILMFGSTLHQIPDILTEDTIFTNKTSYFNHLIDNTKQMMDDFLQQRKINADRIRTNANKKRTVIDYNAGDIVYCKNSRIAEIDGGALQSKFDGPFEILTIDNKHCRLRDITTNVEKMAHSQNLKKLHRADFGTIIPDRIKHQSLTRENINNPTDNPQTNSDINTTSRKSTRINDPKYTHKFLNK
jgi:hypothetical protein